MKYLPAVLAAFVLIVPSQGFLEYTKDPMFVLLDACREDGNEEATLGLQENLQKLKECYMRVDPTAVRSLLQASVQEGRFTETATIECRMLRQLEECFPIAKGAIELCRNQSIHKILSTALNLCETSINFFCSDDGVNLERILADGALECLYNNAMDEVKCLAPILQNKIKQPFSEDTNYCELVNGAGKCIIRELESCNKRTSVDIFRSLLGKLSRAIPCSAAQCSSSATPTITLLSYLALLAGRLL